MTAVMFSRDQLRRAASLPTKISCSSASVGALITGLALSIRFRVLSQCDPVANGVDTSLLENVSPIEWDSVVLYGQYILDRKLVRRRRRSMKGALSV
jgi:hypothetical protein